MTALRFEDVSIGNRFSSLLLWNTSRIKYFNALRALNKILDLPSDDVSLQTHVVAAQSRI